MKNNNHAAVRRLSARSLKNNRVRNLFTVCAIILTAMLFTAVFSLFSAMILAGQESTMREVGTRSHAGLKDADMQQYGQAAADPLVKRCSYDIFLGTADNIQKRQAELRFMPFEEALPDYFITLKEGSLPKEEDSIVVDTFVLDELKIPHELGETVPITFTFMGKTVEKEFRVSGYYEGSPISHASELFVSEPFWLQVKGGYTEADFRAWAEEHPDDNGKGLLSVNLFFDNASNLEEKVRSVIQNMGYEPETELDYGVNWAYMQGRLESVDLFSISILCGALGVILLTGYLIIYNIFQISIMGDIRFYGLLKTIGTTKRQISRLVLRQVLLLSVAGIPIGLLAGYAVGCIGAPIVARVTHNSNGMTVDVSLHPDPFIFLFGAVFSAATIFFSCRKPGKIAGSVSPVEAVKYTEVKGKKRARRKRRQFSPITMALANLGRNKKKTVIVVLAISMSMVLLILVMTGVGSFRISQYLEQRIAGDAMIAGADVFRSSPGSNYDLDKKYVEFVESQPGIEQIDEMWIDYGKSVVVDEKGKAGLQRLGKEGKLYQEDQIGNPMEQEGFAGYVFGYTDGLFSNIKVLEGSLDVDQFQNGDYILLGRFYGNEILEPEDSIYHPGDKVVVSSVTKDTVSRDVKDGSGEIIGVEYENLSQKQYEVMAIVDCPSSMNMGRYSPNGMDAVLPLKELMDPQQAIGSCFVKSYQVADDKKAVFEAALKDYTENVDTAMGYASKQSLEQEFSGMVGAISAIGIAMSIVIAFVGMLNFINAVFTGIISRKREFAMLQSIGMTKGQLRGVVVCEGVCYVMVAGMISLVVGSLLAYAVLHALNNVIMFFEYRFQILPFLVMFPILLAIAAVAPAVSFHQICKESVVERLLEAE